MKVRDVMTTEVVTVGPATSLKDVIEQMVRAGVSGVPVVDGDRLLGIVTEADCISKEAYGHRRRRALALLGDVLTGRDHPWVAKAAGLAAADVMSAHPVVCRPGDDVASAARTMLEHGVKRMPVVEDGRLRGIVSRQDVLRTFDRSDDAIAGDVAEALTTHPNLPDDCHVRSSVADGVVTLVGDVRYEWDEAAVVAIVRSVPGVLDVVSTLRHRHRNPRTSANPWGADVVWPSRGGRP